MRNGVRRLPVFLLAGMMLVATQLPATTLRQMDLGDLVQRAERIFRGTVVSVEQSSIAVGGGEMPMVVYRLRVEEQIKGAADVVKGGKAMVVIRMVGSLKGPRTIGEAQHRSPFYDVPKLRKGGDYLLFTTPPSAVGLSTTVGLGQGAFDVISQEKVDYAVNQYSNLGLGVGEGGPVNYAELTAAIKGLMGE